MKKKGFKLGRAAPAALGFLVLVLGSCGSLFAKKETEVTQFWDTSQMQAVTKITNDGTYKLWAKVSSDGVQLLYSELDKSGISNIALLRNVNSPAKTQLVSNANNPAWYDNNNQYLYVVSENNGQKLMRSAVSGSSKTYVTRDPVGVGDTRPSVRGQAILCDTLEGQTRRLYSMKDNGTEITSLGDGWAPSWHPTEPKFVFVRETDDRNWAIYEMDLVSTQVTQIYGDSKYRSTNPSYSWDGQHILFQRGAEEIKTGRRVTKQGGNKTTDETVSTEDRWHLFVVRTDGTGGPTQLTRGNVDAYSPTWDSNGNVFFIAGTGNKSREIYRARINLEEEGEAETYERQEQ
jgi:dipeptidyl aminopeptidase/acylaminoacyl peptidase